MFSDALKSEKTPLVSMYGSLAGLQELGPEVIKSVVIPQVRAISHRIDVANSNMQMSNNQKLDTTAVQKIRTLVQNSVVPVLKASRPPPDIEQVYVNEFGCLGTILFEQVQKERQRAAAAAATIGTTATPSLPTSSVPVAMARPSQPSAQNLNPQMINTGSTGQRFVIVNQQPGVPNPGTGNNQQRVVLTPTQQPQQRFGTYYQPPQ